MKRLIPKLQNSQRDNRWGSILLGNNSLSQFNIYNYGCLITCFGNYIGETPQSVNSHKEMFTNGGGDFIWGKSTAIGLNNTYTSPRFEDAVPSSEVVKMKGYIDQGKPLIMEVDFNPSTISEEQHYVLVIGYDDSGEFIILDPWTGSVVSLGVYGGVSRAMYTYRVYDKTLAFETSPVDDCPAKLKEKTELETYLRGEIDKKQARIDTLLNENDTLSKQNLSLQTDLQSVKDHDKVTLDAALSKQRTDLLIDFASEKKALQSDYEAKLLEASKNQITITKEVETPLDKRFHGKSKSVKFKAVTEIILA